MSNKSRRGTSKPRTNLSRRANLRRRLRDPRLMKQLALTEHAGNKAIKAQKAAEAEAARRAREELPGLQFDEARRLQQSTEAWDQAYQEVNFKGRAG